MLPNGVDGTVEHWDLGMTDAPVGLLTPTGTVLQAVRGTDVSATSPGSNAVTDAPGLKEPYALSVDVLASRTYPAFRQSVVIAELLPANLMGDYHLAGTGSPAYQRGQFGATVDWYGTTPTTRYTVAEPADDIDGDSRPTVATSPRKWDSGSDQLGTVSAPGFAGLASPFAAVLGLAEAAVDVPAVDPPAVDPPVVDPPVVTPPVVTPPLVVTPPSVLTPPPAAAQKQATRLVAAPAAARTPQGRRVRLVATLSPGALGRVWFRQGSRTLCSAPVHATHASCRTSPRLARGLHRVVVTYSGSSTRLPARDRLRFRIT